MTKSLSRDLLAGAYWRVKPGRQAQGAIIYTGALAGEAAAAHASLADDSIGLLAVTSADRLYRDWRAQGEKSHIARLLSDLRPAARLVTVLDGHPAALTWTGSVGGHRARSLGVDQFGQCGNVNDLYRAYGIDAAAIEAAFRG